MKKFLIDKIGLALVIMMIGISYHGHEYAAAYYKQITLNHAQISNPNLQIPETHTTEKTQNTTLRLFDMRHRFNEGDPIVFVGMLTDMFSIPISNAKIMILHDGTCPNRIVATGMTDKDGRFFILTSAKIWDKNDNLVQTHAEFLGQEKFFPSKSESKLVVTFPMQNRSCMN